MPDTSTEHEGQADATTPRPWGVDSSGEISAGPYGETTVVGIIERGREYMRYQELVLSRADAALIVRAVNNHDALRTALVEAVDEQAMAVDALRTWASHIEQSGTFPRTIELMRELASRLERDLDKRRKVLEVSK